jgi:ribosomal protein S12
MGRQNKIAEPASPPTTEYIEGGRVCNILGVDYRTVGEWRGAAFSVGATARSRRESRCRFTTNL